MSRSRLRSLRRSTLGKATVKPAVLGGRRQIGGVGVPAATEQVGETPAPPLVIAGAAPDANVVVIVDRLVVSHFRLSLQDSVLVPGVAGFVRSQAAVSTAPDFVRSQGNDQNSHELCYWPSQSVVCAAPSALGAWIGTMAAGETIVKKPRRMRSKTPVWQAASRRLFFDGVLVKTLRRDAHNLALVLDAFANAGWRRWIADPFPPDDEVDPHDRLYNTVRRLNSQRHPLIKFSCDGDGTGLCWEPL